MTRSTVAPTASRFAISKASLLLMAGVVVLAALYWSPSAVAEKPVAIPPPSAQALAGLAPAKPTEETVVFAGGCFWGIQAVFQHTTGVLQAVSGYAGGTPADANYQRVSGGGTGHAEAVQVRFDPRQISYAQLLQIYFSVAHDPTQLNRQYPDVGPQYRSAVFYADASQKALAERYIAELDAAKVFPSKIVTQLSPLSGFYPAEKYHQNYATLHPDALYIARYDLPKIANLKTLLPGVYREQPVLVAN
ncbi:peptide-methionine (S)-S-oxide reductase [Rhodoferax sp. OV413]|uniref:peptide-methionine (S)-S-oxide reductase MsrA n=1 Tax=Rhodoferax sp. OV413 TaxID=1855285 RepID=UPI00087FB3E4|nr:peptide-methionine (S)-S-oxide reductase MsrA [Rhodoferax sp. OV413]SDP72727.1 peptide-methionine (S)-S-oxide reductase [Rhodoferax sp. OV413]